MITNKNLDRQCVGVIGIDPGATGAIAVWYCGGIAKVIDIPLHTVIISGSTRKVIDYEAFSNILIEYINQGYKFCVELTQVLCVGAGSSSIANWNLGYSQGFLTALLLLKGASFQFTRPQEWHKFYGYNTINFKHLDLIQNKSQRDKERKRLLKAYSLQKAQEIAPQIILTQEGKKFKTGRVTADKVFDGRCEAILIANYGAKYNGRKLS